MLYHVINMTNVHNMCCSPQVYDKLPGKQGHNGSDGREGLRWIRLFLVNMTINYCFIEAGVPLVVFVLEKRHSTRQV